MRGKEVEAHFSSSYLQQLTQELSEDLDKVRNSDDFKADSVPFLVHALAQGTSQFSTEDKERVIQAGKDGAEDK